MRRLLLSLLSLACASALALSPLSAAPARARIVAIGDVHGGDTAFVAILERAGLIDRDRKWVGANTVRTAVVAR